MVRMGELGDSSGLIARKLFVQRSALCASPGYLARRGTPRGIEDLQKHGLITYGRDGSVHPWTLVGANGKAVAYRPASRLVMGHGEPMLDAAVAGCSIAWLPPWLLEHALRRGDLVPVLPGKPVKNLTVHAVWPATRNATCSRRPGSASTKCSPVARL